MSLNEYYIEALKRRIADEQVNLIWDENAACSYTADSATIEQRRKALVALRRELGDAESVI